MSWNFLELCSYVYSRLVACCCFFVSFLFVGVFCCFLFGFLFCFFKRYLLSAKEVIGSVSVYLEEGRSEIKLDCELMFTYFLVCCPFRVSEETENYIGIQNQKARVVWWQSKFC